MGKHKRGKPLVGQASATPGPPLQSEPLTPIGHQLKQLFIRLAAAGGVKHPHFIQRTNDQQFTGDSHPYIPLAQADPTTGTMFFNPHGSGGIGTQPRDKLFRRFTAAHETGHTVEPGLIGNRANADRYQQEALGYLGRPWLTKSVAGRAENRMQVQQRDPWGLPLEGPQGTHTAPVELYANDAAAGFGVQGPMAEYRNQRGIPALGRHGAAYQSSQAAPDHIKRLQAMGLLPQTVFKSKRRGKSR